MMTELDVRKSQYEAIVDEVVYIARASEGALSAEWIMSQPISVRKKYLEFFIEERKRLEKSVNK